MPRVPSREAEPEQRRPKMLSSNHPWYSNARVWVKELWESYGHTSTPPHIEARDAEALRIFHDKVVVKREPITAKELDAFHAIRNRVLGLRK